MSAASRRSPGATRSIKLSSNESALGPSPRALAAYQKAAADMHRYPDGGSIALREAIGTRFGFDPDRIVCGAGSDELLGLLGRAYAGPGDEVVYSEHGFLIYPIVAHSVGATPVKAGETNLTSDVDKLLAKVTPRTRLLYIANPNNPTGSYISGHRARAPAPRAAGRRAAGDRRGLRRIRHRQRLRGGCRTGRRRGRCRRQCGDDAHLLENLRHGRHAAGLGLLPADGRRPAQPVAHAVQCVRRGPGRRHRGARGCRLRQRGARSQRKMARLADGGIAQPRLSRASERRQFRARAVRRRRASRREAADNFLAARGIIARQVDKYGLPDCLRITIGLEHEMRAVAEALAAFRKAG